MKLIVLASLLLVSLAPLASAADGPCVRYGHYEVCPLDDVVVWTPGCEPGEYGVCTYTDGNGDRCVRIQIGYHDITHCIGRAAAPASAGICTPPVSQWGVCYAAGCATVDGPMTHKEACPGDLVYLDTACDDNPDVCTYSGSNGERCVRVIFSYSSYTRCVTPRA